MADANQTTPADVSGCVFIECHSAGRCRAPDFQITCKRVINHRPFQTTGWTDRQREQFEIGRAFHDGGFPRAAPHDESEWRWWLKGWDCAQMDRELDEHLAGTP